MGSSDNKCLIVALRLLKLNAFQFALASNKTCIGLGTCWLTHIGWLFTPLNLLSLLSIHMGGALSGYRAYYLLPKKIDGPVTISDEEVLALREEAKKNKWNIGKEEQARRLGRAPIFAFLALVMAYFGFHAAAVFPMTWIAIASYHSGKDGV